MSSTVQVKHAGGEYPVLCGSGVVLKARAHRTAEEKEIWQKHVIKKGAMAIVSNKTVWDLYGDRLERTFTSATMPWREPIILPDSECNEQAKNWKTVGFILNQLADRGIKRDGTLVAVGGGVIGDMAGFAAAVYMRGIRLVQVPTTLLAMVDSAIGGKTGVNSPYGKNLFGAFHQPAAVLCDTDFLSTLPKEEFYCGLAEVVKYAMLGDAEFFGWLEANAHFFQDKPNPAVVAYVVEKSVQAKAAIVAADERETGGQRALLNLGHTFAHGLENIAGYGSWRHGEAVAAGLVAAARLSEKLLGFAAKDTKRIVKLLKKFKLPTRFVSPEKAQQATDEDRQRWLQQFLTAIQADKKNMMSEHRFVLMKSLGEAELTTVTDIRAVEQVVKEML